MSHRDILRRFIADTFFVEEFSDHESFLRSGIIDSTGMMELIQFLEEKLSVRMVDSDLVPENLDSIDNLLRFIGRKAAVGQV
ncbi:acyl carrier protein [Nevskia soli]|uniref:acyl carrier protein n=1 Tax=Nevskia soli TaxID=418856 RepID=UPI0004A705A9|nr:acyl carrier protein [Nevskia soli]